MTRRYGLEASSSLTLFDPASFFAAADNEARGAAPPSRPPDLDVRVALSSGPAEAAAGAPNPARAAARAAAADWLGGLAKGLGGGANASVTNGGRQPPAPPHLPFLGGEYAARLVAELRKASAALAAEAGAPNM